jgi:serine/threonine protein kinase
MQQEREKCGGEAHLRTNFFYSIFFPLDLLFRDEMQTRALVADWGLASRFVEGVPLKQDCGSMHYAAPEILGGRQYDGDKVDSFSLGILLFALTTGCFPFVGRTPRARLLDIVTREKLPFPRGFSFAIRDLLCALLETDPSIRMTATEALEHDFFAPIVETRQVAADAASTSAPVAAVDDDEPAPASSGPVAAAPRQTRPRSNSRSLSPAKQKIKSFWGKLRSTSPPSSSAVPSSSSSSSSTSSPSKSKTKRRRRSSFKSSNSSSLDD